MASPRPTGADPLGAGAGRRRRQGAFLCTDLKPTEILGWFVRRWRVEVTFAEVRRHLGVERQCLAILRTTPALLGLFSLVTLWANRIKGNTVCCPTASAGIPKPIQPSATPSLSFDSNSGPHRLVTGSPGERKKYRQAHQSPDPRRLQSSLILQSPA